MSFDYKQGWEELERWLKQGIDYMQGRVDEDKEILHPNHTHRARINSKLNTMKMVQQHMETSRKMYTREDEDSECKNRG